MSPTTPVAWLAALALAIAGTSNGDDVDVVVREICRRVYTEGPTEGDLERETAQIAALGEPARKALVQLARSLSKRPTVDGGLATEGDRAIGLLVALEDPRALSIARGHLARRSAAPGLHERGLWVVAHYRDAASAARVRALFGSSESEDVLRGAAHALSELRDENSLRVLRAALLDPRYRAIQGDLVEKVGIPRHDEAVDVLVELANEHPLYRSNESARARVSPASSGSVRLGAWSRQP